ncbi:hypothetical protein JCM10450v2_000107 [Rhodotorula kratochvilovae]
MSGSIPLPPLLSAASPSPVLVCSPSLMDLLEEVAAFVQIPRPVSVHSGDEMASAEALSEQYDDTPSARIKAIVYSEKARLFGLRDESAEIMEGLQQTAFFSDNKFDFNKAPNLLLSICGHPKLHAGMEKLQSWASSWRNPLARSCAACAALVAPRGLFGRPREQPPSLLSSDSQCDVAEEILLHGRTARKPATSAEPARPQTGEA